MASRSARSTAPYRTLASAPILTRPMSMAPGATKAVPATSGRSWPSASSGGGPVPGRGAGWPLAGRAGRSRAALSRPRSMPSRNGRRSPRTYTPLVIIVRVSQQANPSEAGESSACRGWVRRLADQCSACHLAGGSMACDTCGPLRRRLITAGAGRRRRGHPPGLWPVSGVTARPRRKARAVSFLPDDGLRRVRQADTGTPRRHRGRPAV